MTARDSEPTYATTGALAGLASEVEGLRRRVEPLHRLPGQVAEVSEQVARLAEQVAEMAADPGPGVVRSWLALDEDDPDLAGRLLAELSGWLETVFLRFPDGAAVLPDCWAWHPDVVEELLWLMQAWSAAYFDDKGGVLRVADWHDRYRPGVVRRLKATAAACSLENHSPPPARPTVPLPEAVGPIATWWGRDRDEPAPEPTEAQFAAVSPRRRGGTRR